MKLIKTYIPMLLSILFFMFYFALIRLNILGYYTTPEINIFLNFGIIIIITFFIEWIYFMIKAATNKELENRALWLMLIYIFNVFIIPYYNFKYVVKSKNVKEKMIIYIILSIIFSIIGLSID